MKYISLSAVVGFFLVVWLSGCQPVAKKNGQNFQDDPSLCRFDRGPCKINQNDITISLHLDPISAPSAKPIQVKLKFNQDVELISMMLSGRDMFMGNIPVQLTKVPNENYSLSNMGKTDSDNSASHYRGEIVYGACASGYMVWQAKVKYKASSGVKQSTFNFLADANEE